MGLMDGVDDCLIYTNSSNLTVLGSEITLFTRIRRVGTGTFQRMFHKGGQDGSNCDYSLGFSNTDKVVFTAGVTSPGDTLSGNIPGLVSNNSFTSKTQDYIMIGRSNGAGTHKLNVDNAVETGSSTNTSNTLIPDLHLGAKNDGSQFFDGYEIVCGAFAYELTDPQITTLIGLIG
jgi:hypothetical protein